MLERYVFINRRARQWPGQSFHFATWHRFEFPSTFLNICLKCNMLSIFFFHKFNAISFQVNFTGETFRFNVYVLTSSFGHLTFDVMWALGWIRWTIAVVFDCIKTCNGLHVFLLWKLVDILVTIGFHDVTTSLWIKRLHQ